MDEASKKKTSNLPSATPAQAGFVAYATLAAVGRMGKDSTMAPSVAQSLQLTKMIEKACLAMRELEKWALKHDEEFSGLVAGFYGNVNDLESRLRPKDWWERLVKSYVTIGLFADLASEVGGGTDLENCFPAMSDFGYGEFAQALLQERVKNDSAEAARLSLWGRRVFGETLGLTREGLTLRLELGVHGTARLIETMHHLADLHEKRMEAAGLSG
ncbi:ferritin-like domain-containing protein [Actinomycetaceae bacterium TAE3-ERU4]|nr:ferritin-like domain-containing protein [Actinomycetaceae bacterium TAE3-ERU4]